VIDASWIEERLRNAGGLRKARPGARPIRGARQDSRAIQPGELFAALRGEQSDGHRHAAAALAAGASGALLAEAELFDELAASHPEASLFLVKAVLPALQALARDWVAEIAPAIVAITGSNGKTGTKDLCRALLATAGPTHASDGNFNNLIGLPMTVLNTPPDTRFLVLEMGCSSLGEIAELCRLFPPRVGIITNIGHAHLEELGGLDGVAKAKGELAEALPESGLLILNAEEPYAARLAARSRAAVKRFGPEGPVELRIDDLGPEGIGARRVRMGEREILLPSPWAHAGQALAAAWLAAAELGAEPDSMATAAASDRAFCERNRGGVFRLGPYTLVDDSYNANPDSLRAALSWLAEAPLPASARRWAILGDMLELGEQGATLHYELGGVAARLGIDGLLACGPLCAQLVVGAREAGLAAEHFSDAAALAGALPARLTDGDLLLIKGSRGMAMESVITALAAATGANRERVT
jgi:UDP-N-acetylmuramoyl-tripeptide--D-alanyl-D-alanine ligase